MCNGTQLLENQQPICSNYDEDEISKYIPKVMSRISLVPRPLFGKGMDMRLVQSVTVDACPTDGVGRWSPANCKRVQSSQGRTICDCSKLGHFGLLFVSYCEAVSFSASANLITSVGHESWGFTFTTGSDDYFLHWSDCLNYLFTHYCSNVSNHKVSISVHVHTDLSHTCTYVHHMY